GAGRRDRGGDPFGDDRCADHRRDDEQVIADADPPVGAAIALERALARAHGLLRSSGGSAIRPSSSDGSCGSRLSRSPPPRALAPLCVCTCAPSGMSAVAVPIELPYLITDPPDGMCAMATLWPRGIGSRTAIAPPFGPTSRPGSSASSAVATLSAALITITALTD